MFKSTNNKRVVVAGKKGSYSVPAKLLQKQPIKQEKLYEEFWKCII